MITRITVVGLITAALTHLVGTLLVGDDYNTFALVLELVLVGLAFLAATGRWWLLGIVGLLSGLLGGLTATTVAGGELDGGQMVVALLFVISTGVAAISGLTGFIRHLLELRGVRPDTP